MIHSLRTLSLGIIGAVALSACSEAATQGPQAENTPQILASPPPKGTHPALWQVSDADTTIYIFGTVHILPSETNWMNGMLYTTLASSDQLVTEIIAPSATEASKAIDLYARLPSGTSLRDLLPAEVRLQYEAELKRYAIPESAFDHYKPWFAATMLSVIPLTKAGYETESGVESVLWNIANEKNIPISALETLEFQLSLFNSLPQEVQIRYLSEMMASSESIEAEVEQMIAAWLNGDPERLAKMMNESQEAAPELVEILLTRRNATWAEWIDQRLDQPGTVFMAVGSGHLAGRDSVQELLEKKGIRARRIQ